MTPQDEATIARFMAEREITKCPPALASGSEASAATKRSVAQKRREWREEQKAKRG